MEVKVEKMVDGGKIETHESMEIRRIVKANHFNTLQGKEISAANSLALER